MGCDGCELWNAKRKSCYAGLQHDTFGPFREGYSSTFEEITLWSGRMAQAARRLSDLRGLRRNEKPWLDGLPRLIFISDMGDALCDEVPFEWLHSEIIKNVVSSAGRRHIWLWLTKRPARMAKFSAWLQKAGIAWPKNLWVGTSITTSTKTWRIDKLLKVGTTETVHFLSVEPQLEPLDLRPWLPRVSWVIQGGESGQLARPFDIAWATSMCEQCKEAGTPYFLKQLGAYAFRGKDRILLTDISTAQTGPSGRTMCHAFGKCQGPPSESDEDPMGHKRKLPDHRSVYAGEEHPAAAAMEPD
jgi:protein gp37